MIKIEEALRTLVRLIEATAARPFGLAALLVFACATVAYVVLRDVHPAASAKLAWVVFGSLIAVSVAVSEALQIAPWLSDFRLTGSVAWSAQAPAPAAAGTDGGSSPAAGRAAAVPGTSGSAGAPRPRSSGQPLRAPSPAGTRAGSAPAVADGTAVRDRTSAGSPAAADAAVTADGGSSFSPDPSPSAAGTVSGSGGAIALPSTGPSSDERRGDSAPALQVWVSRGTLVNEISTGDHRCPDEAAGIVDCDGHPTRRTYVLTLPAGPLERLSQPQLRCVDGPCSASRINFTRLSADGRTAEASFEAWSAPTRWRLTATREVLPEAR